MTIEMEIDPKLADWAAQNAARHGLSLDAYVEMLIALESGLTSSPRDGRTLRTRAFTYRDADSYLVSSSVTETA